MVTITHNDLVPEQLANMRRGPFAAPTESEKVEYLMTRVRTDRHRHQFENYGLEHVLSYQRRISATKASFIRRNQKGPLGIVRDFWDRTIEGVPSKPACQPVGRARILRKEKETDIPIHTNAHI